MRSTNFDGRRSGIQTRRAGVFALKELLLLLVCLSGFVWLIPQWVLRSVAAPSAQKSLNKAVVNRGINRISLIKNTRQMWVFRSHQGVTRLNLATGAVEEDLQLMGGEITDVKHSQDGQTSLVLACDGAAELMYAGDQPQVIRWPGLPEERAAPINGDLSSDGTIAIIAMENGQIQGWCRDDSGWQPFAYSLLNGSNLLSATMDWTGKLLLVAYADGTVSCHDAKTGALQIEYFKFPHICTSTAWSDDGHTIVLGFFGGMIRVLDALTGATKAKMKLVSRSKFEYVRVMAVAISPDTRHVAASCDFSTHVHVWDLNAINATHPLSGNAGLIRALEFSPDSKALYSGGWDGTIREWSLATYSQQHMIE